MLLCRQSPSFRSFRAFAVPLSLLAACAPSGDEVEGPDEAAVAAPAEGPRAEGAAIAAGLGATTGAAATVYQVGPGKAYADLRSVASKLLPGDVVEVYAKGAAYAGGVLFTRPGSATAKITIRGVRVNGARPIIAGGTNTVEFQGDHYVFEGFDVTGGSARVLYHHAHDITVRDTVVHDCPQHGILGADEDSGSLTLDYVEVARCGYGDQKHPIYVATDESRFPNAVFRMQHSYVHDGKGGNNVKSRAARNEIYYNWIEGGYYRELELVGPDGQDPSLKREDSDVVGNVFYQTKGTYMVRVGGDGTGSTSGRYRFVNNTFVQRAGNAKAVIQAFDEVETLELHNNVFYRLGGGGVQLVRDLEAAWVSGAPRASGSRNWAPTGSSGVPAGVTGTVTGADPKFVNAAGRDLRAALGSPLVNAGASTFASPAGYAFPSPLAAPAYLPPAHVLQRPGGALRRVVAGAMDISAFE
jgi:hypothetical protein